jgi:hypothetical protein
MMRIDSQTRRIVFGFTRPNPTNIDDALELREGTQKVPTQTQLYQQVLRQAPTPSDMHAKIAAPHRQIVLAVFTRIDCDVPVP